MIRKSNNRIDGFKFQLDLLRDDFKDFVKKVGKRFDKMYTLVDGIAGDYKKISEEQDLLSGRVRFVHI